jgi:hypothetical protein
MSIAIAVIRLTMDSLLHFLDQTFVLWSRKQTAQKQFCGLWKSLLFLIDAVSKIVDSLRPVIDEVTSEGRLTV